MMYGNLQPENTSERPPKRKFWQNLLITDSGDLKKVLSLSSLLLSFGLLVIYFIAYIFLMPLVERIAGQWPVTAANLAESLIPALAASAVILLFWPLFRDKRVLPAAYLWLTLIAVAILIVVSVKLRDDPTAQRTFLYVFCWNVIPALLVGNFLVWRRYLKFIRL